MNVMIITNKDMCLGDVTAQPKMTTNSSDKSFYMLSFIKLFDSVLTEKRK